MDWSAAKSATMTTTSSTTPRPRWLAEWRERLVADDDQQHFETMEQLNIRFKKRMGKAKTEDEPAIREEWMAAKTAFFAEEAEQEEARQQGEAAAAELRDSAQRSDSEAIEAAMRAYGPPVAGHTVMGRVAASIPTPIETHWPTVEITTGEDER
jgi:hypothetical protein